MANAAQVEKCAAFLKRAINRAATVWCDLWRWIGKLAMNRFQFL